MMTKDEIMKVLDAMNYAISPSGTFWVKKHNEAKQILQAALAELEGEPATVLRLIDTIKYLVGIAERGEGRKARDDELPEQFVLGYVKRLEAALARVDKPLEPSEPVAWQLGHRFYTSLKDAEYAWRNDCAFLGTSYVPEPLFTHPASKPEPSEPVAEVAGDYNTKHIIFLPAGIALEVGDKLFTHPAKPEPLTDEAISKMYIEHSAYQEEGPETSGWYDFARAVEAAILEKLK